MVPGSLIAVVPPLVADGVAAGDLWRLDEDVDMVLLALRPRRDWNKTDSKQQHNSIMADSELLL